VRPDRRPHLPPGGYVITVGERRFRAAQLAGLATIPALIHDVDETQALLDALIENVQRQDLTPDEEHEAVQLLRERGLTDSDIARRLGVSKSTISRLVAVFDDAILGPRVADGRLSLTQARELLNLPEPDRARLADFLLLRQREARLVGRAELRELVAAALGPDRHTPAIETDPPRAVMIATEKVDSRPASASHPANTGGRVADPKDPVPAVPISLESPVAGSMAADRVVVATLVGARRERDRVRAQARARELYREMEFTLAMLSRELDDAEVQATLQACEGLLSGALHKPA
jgi:transcriptional regulator with XRE-family HTH domain